MMSSILKVIYAHIVFKYLSMFYDKQKKQKNISFSIKRVLRTIQLFGVELNSKLSNAKFIIIYILNFTF